MATRPLRQYYDGVTVEVDDDFGSLVEPWLRHRRRLIASLGELSEAEWKAPTRCDRWDGRGVVSHLITVDAFWLMSFRAARARDTPTTYIRGFDPSTGTDDLIAPMLDLPGEVLLERLVEGTDALVVEVEAIDADGWSAPGEAPFGHMPAQLILGHAFWDSWLHERDILEPLGQAPDIESDEVLAALWYSLVFAGLQGGLLEDPEPVGSLPEAPIDVTLGFEELPDTPLRVRIDSGVHVSTGAAERAVEAGSALDLVESVTGRKSASARRSLPTDFEAQLARAAQIL